MRVAGAYPLTFGICKFVINGETEVAKPLKTAVGAFALTDGAFELSSGYGDNLNYAYLWSLGEYRTYVNKEEQAEARDELEKSVIASVADDVIVGVKGNCAEVVIIKKFA
jgi:hypothetical protein